jgi:hypothetical protein
VKSRDQCGYQACIEGAETMPSYLGVLCYVRGKDQKTDESDNLYRFIFSFDCGFPSYKTV